jgi:hypothetical protein
MFPRFTLSGSFGQTSNTTSALLESGSSVWSLGANITAPLFRGGALWHQRKVAIEAYQAALANYQGSVLGGFQQVADTLRALEHDAESVAAQTRALDAAADSLKLIQANYRAGLAGYLQVLVADVQYHQASIAQLQARAQRLQDTTALFVALGGGWWNANPQMVGVRSLGRLYLGLHAKPRLSAVPLKLEPTSSRPAVKIDNGMPRNSWSRGFPVVGAADLTRRFGALVAVDHASFEVRGARSLG